MGRRLRREQSPHVIFALENEPFPYDVRVLQEAKALVEAGYAVTVCAPRGEAFGTVDKEVDGVRTVRYATPPQGKSVLGYIREYLLAVGRMRAAITRVHRVQPADAVVVITPPELLVVSALALKRAGAALIIDHHDLSPELLEAKFGPRPVLYAAVASVERLALSQADVVITTNARYAEVITQRGGAACQRLYIVRNGADRERIYPVQPNLELKRGRPWLVCWVGAMSAQKGLPLLVEAAAELIKARGRTDVTIAVIGDGEVRNDIIAAADERGLAPWMDFPGRADDELIRQYMSTADVCVRVDPGNPKNNTSTITTVVEYMLMGRAIVQFPRTEAREMCAETTVYARDGDACDLARQVEELLDDTGRRHALGAAAQARAQTQLLWAQQIPSLLTAVEHGLDLARSRARKSNIATNSPGHAG